MKAHSLFVAALTAALLAAGAHAAEMDAKSSEKAAAPEPQKPAKTPEGWPVLKAGLTGDEVIKLIGKPSSTRPLESKEGKAEVWVYRRLAKHITRQTAATTANTQTYGTDGTATISVPVMKMENIFVYQVSSLLMFDGKLVTATQKVETERRFE